LIINRFKKLYSTWGFELIYHQAHPTGRGYP
jgi:hypothetical protein